MSASLPHTPPSDREIRLIELLTDVLDEYKAQDVLKLDLRPFNAYTDSMILCTGTSTRHVANLARYSLKAARSHRYQILSVEGEQYNEWIAIDLNFLVLHIMLKDIREFYAIEKIWSE